jgi:Fe-S-cluster containining protein
VLLDDGSILPFENDRCPHVTDAGRCRIYETRPRGCREFDCSREPGYLRTHPHVAALLTLHGVPMAVAPAKA